LNYLRTTTTILLIALREPMLYSGFISVTLALALLLALVIVQYSVYACGAQRNIFKVIIIALCIVRMIILFSCWLLRIVYTVITVVFIGYALFPKPDFLSCFWLSLFFKCHHISSLLLDPLLKFQVVELALPTAPIVKVQIVC